MNLARIADVALGVFALGVFTIALVARVRRRREARKVYHSDRDARRMAAYRVLFGLVNPDRAVDAASFDDIDRQYMVYRVWAGQQDPETRRAYAAAADQLLERARGVYVNNTRARQIMTTIDIMRVPPPEIMARARRLPTPEGPADNEDLEADVDPAVQQQPEIIVYTGGNRLVAEPRR